MLQIGNNGTTGFFSGNIILNGEWSNGDTRNATTSWRAALLDFRRSDGYVLLPTQSISLAQQTMGGVAGQANATVRINTTGTGVETNGANFYLANWSGSDKNNLIAITGGAGGILQVGAGVANTRLVISNGSTLNLAYLGLGETQVNYNAAVVQEAGTTVNAGQARVGHWAGTYNYTMNGGTFNVYAYSPNVTGNSPVGPQAGETYGGIYVGIDGVSWFNQNAGTVNTNFVSIDNRGTTSGTLNGQTTYGTYNLNGGTLNVKAGWGVGSANATAYLVMNGGTLSIDNTGLGSMTGANLNVPLFALNRVDATSTLTTNGAGNAYTISRDIGGTGTLNLAGNGTIYLNPTSFGQSVNALLTGNNALVKLGTNTTTLWRANTVSAGLIVRQGGLGLNNAGALGTGILNLLESSGLSLDNSSGGDLTLSTNNAIGLSADFTFTGSNGSALNLGTGAVALAGTRGITTTAGTLTLGGVISGNGMLHKYGAGTLALTGTNTFQMAALGDASSVVVGAGTLLINADAALGTAPASAKVSTLLLAGGALQASANTTVSTNRGIELLSGTTGGLAASASTTLTYAGVVNGLGALAVNAATSATGTVVLSSADTFMGGTTVSRGTLQLGNAGALGIGTLALNGGTVNGSTALTTLTLGGLSGTPTGAVLSLSNTNATPAAIALSVGSNNASTSYLGVISGLGSVTKTGTGTLTLAGANTYTGATAVNRGGLTLDFSAATPTTNILASTTALSLGGGTLTLTGKATTVNAQTVGSLTLNSGANAIVENLNTATSLALTVGAITANAGATLDVTLPTGTLSATNGFNTSTAALNGILGGYATANAGAGWLVPSATGSSALSGEVAMPPTGATSTVNYAVTATAATTTSQAVNALRLSPAAATTLTIATGFP